MSLIAVNVGRRRCFSGPSNLRLPANLRLVRKHVLTTVKRTGKRTKGKVCGADRLCASVDRRAEPRPAARRARRRWLQNRVKDYASGTKGDRPGLANALVHLRRGDALIVWKLDRLGRSMADLIDTIRRLETKGIGFCSLTEGVDTTTPIGTLVFYIFGALAKFERERTNAGLKASRSARQEGRPKASRHV